MLLRQSLVVVSSALSVLALSASAAGEDCSWTDWQSKWDLNVQVECSFGAYAKGIAFNHRLHENLTHQENYSLLCCNDARATPNFCSDRGWTSKFALTASDSVPQSTYVRAVAFYHSNDENLTYQESFRLTQCAWNGSSSEATYETNYVSKFPLTVQDQCPDDYYMSGITFHHSNDENLTYQESFRLLCHHF